MARELKFVYSWSNVFAALCGKRVTLRGPWAGLRCRGLPLGYPAIAVFNATRAEQIILTGRIATLPHQIAAVDIGAPCRAPSTAGIAASP